MNLTLTSHRAGLAALLALSACADIPEDTEHAEISGQEEALYNGNVVTSGPLDSPASRVVHVTAYDGRNLDCTGVLLTSRWVLTAAHCVSTAWKGFVWASSPWGYTSGTVLRTIVNPYFHYNDYVASGASERMAYAVADLALIELDTPAWPVEHFAQPLAILRDRPTPGQSMHCYGFGWGDRSKTKDPTLTLRDAWLPVGSLTYVEDDEHSTNVGFTVRRNWLGQDIADGDSGGPCFVGDGASAMLAGINSSTTSPGGVDAFADEVQPGMYIGWIADALKDEITSISLTYGGNYGWPLDVSNYPSNTPLHTVPYACLGQRSCTYSADWLGPDYANGGGDLVATWRCGLYPTVNSAQATPPIAGKNLYPSCVGMKWIGPITRLPN